jgi:hypothetical protein
MNKKGGKISHTQRNKLCPKKNGFIWKVNNRNLRKAENYQENKWFKE